MPKMIKTGKVQYFQKLHITTYCNIFQSWFTAAIIIILLIISKSSKDVQLTIYSSKPFLKSKSKHFSVRTQWPNDCGILPWILQSKI